MNGRVVGVVPAAGHATRLQPLTGSKEMIEVQGRPVVQFLIDGLRLAGCEELRVVTRPEKGDLAAYAAAQGATVVLATPASVSESLTVALADVDDEDVVLSGFPDTVWEPVDAFSRLRAEVAVPTEIVLGLFEVDEAADCDRVWLGASGRVQGIEVDPSDTRSSLTWGCFAAFGGVLRGLEGHEPGAYFDSLCAGDHVRGVLLSNRYLDIGTPAGLERVRSWFGDSRDQAPRRPGS
jgi:dTDP-glucose pyrophosphorylase